MNVMFMVRIVSVFKALLWNIQMFPDMLKERRRIQSERVISPKKVKEIMYKHFPQIMKYGLFKIIKGIMGIEDDIKKTWN